jgi:hypothetical protein
MALVLRQIVVDEDRLQRVVEIVLDLLDLGDFRQLRDVQRAALEGEAVRPIEPRVERLDLAFSALVDDDIDLVEKLDRYHREGRIREIADYCESDVLNTYRVWLRYELFRGGLSYEAFRASEDNLVQFINMRGNTKPHLTELIVCVDPLQNHLIARGRQLVCAVVTRARIPETNGEQRCRAGKQTDQGVDSCPKDNQCSPQFSSRISVG